MKKQTISTITITLLDREYRVACPQEEREELLHTAELLNDKMKEIKNSGSVVGIDRIAIMSALNITHEMRMHRTVSESYQKTISGKIRNLQEKVEKSVARVKTA